MPLRHRAIDFWEPLDLGLQTGLRRNPEVALPDSSRIAVYLSAISY